MVKDNDKADADNSTGITNKLLTWAILSGPLLEGHVQEPSWRICPASPEAVVELLPDGMHRERGIGFPVLRLLVGESMSLTTAHVHVNMASGLCVVINFLASHIYAFSLIIYISFTTNLPDPPLAVRPHLQKPDRPTPKVKTACRATRQEDLEP